jgi:hypothetical protein
MFFQKNVTRFETIRGEPRSSEMTGISSTQLFSQCSENGRWRLKNVAALEPQSYDDLTVGRFFGRVPSKFRLRKTRLRLGYVETTSNFFCRSGSARAFVALYVLQDDRTTEVARRKAVILRH